MKIMTRSQWGARPFRNGPPRVPLSSRREVTIHYPGAGTPPKDVKSYAKWIERIHMDQNGWRGVGYNYFVDAYGNVAEGCGRDVRGAHSPPHNVDGIGINIWTANGIPTDAGKRAARELYDLLCKQSGRKLRIGWHGRDYATACPGSHLIAWCKAGMPRPGGGSSTPTNDTDWMTRMFKNVSEFKKAVINAAWGDRFPNPNPNKSSVKKNPHISGYTYLAWIYGNSRQANENSAAALAIAKAGAKKSGITDADLAKVEKAAREGAHAGVDDKIGDADVTLEVKE